MKTEVVVDAGGNVLSLKFDIATGIVPGIELKLTCGAAESLNRKLDAAVRRAQDRRRQQEDRQPRRVV